MEYQLIERKGRQRKDTLKKKSKMINAKYFDHILEREREM